MSEYPKEFLDNIGLIDSLIVDCNSLVQKIVAGEYIGFCAKTVEMVQKLANLKQGVKNDIESLKKQLEGRDADVQG